MKTHSYLSSLGILALAASAMLPVSAQSAQRIELKAIGSVAAGSYESSAAEIAAYDPASKRVFVVNAQLAQIDVISIKDPANPEITDTIDVKQFGAVANSVSVKNGIIAVAVEDAVKTNPGSVVFFDRSLNLINSVQVGGLPDMLTFSPDGRYVLVANEGEPNHYLQPGDVDYDPANPKVDPEGSVSVIDLSRGVKKVTQADVRNADFRAFNKKMLPPGVRVFGPGSTVAQDMEPEYIAVSQDSKTAWVTCQENNTIAVVDLKSATVRELLPIGYKDHNSTAASTTVYSFKPAQLPVIGTTEGGQPLNLGGFSGLHFEGIDPNTGRYKFVSNTDRGPNAEPTGILRPFLLPNFTPEIVRFELDPKTRKLTITQRIALQRAQGVPLTGLPNTAIDSSGNTPYNDEVPVDLLGNVLQRDPYGADLEGVVVDPQDGSFWMVDEYRPAIYHFSAAGVLIDRFVPVGTAAAAGQAPGTFGTEVLPAIIANRRQNRGFEAIAMDNGKIYAFVQSPVRNPASLSNGALNGMRNIRIVEFDPQTQATKQFIYVMDNPDFGGGDNTRADKIGDAVSFGNGEFLVVERDDDKESSDALEFIEKKIYRFNLTGATDVTGQDGLIGSTGKTVDQLTVAEMVANGIKPVEKILHVDLNTAGYNQVEKVEGLTIIDPWTIAVINDNDFGVANITVNSDGTFVRNYVPEQVQLGIIEVRSNGFDASDRDSKINIRPWPVIGVYRPDAIAAYKVGSKEYLVTANEGDAREWPGFIEAVRLGHSSVTLDPQRFPNAAVLKDNANLGRLNILKTAGKNPNTGFYDEIYAFGSRSFSIWSTKGELVYDSADDFEMITSQVYPENFNASNTSNEFDNRSDDKGPEPEGVVVGKVFGRTYAFIGLERIGGVMVYDVTKPAAPEFVQYINYRNFEAAPETAEALDLGPEGLLFIEAEDSPNRKPLLVISNEISGTTTVYEINRAK